MDKVTVLTLGLAVCAGLAGRADDKKEKAPSAFDAGRLLGTWTFAAGAKGGEKVPADQLKGMSLVVVKDTMTLKTPDGDFKIKYTVDASKSPPEVDLEILEGPVGKGMKSKGVVGFDGEALKLTYHSMGGDRPKTFDAKDKGVHAFTLKRAEEKKEK